MPRPPTSCCSRPENGRFYTLGADRLPGGRGFGEPVRAMVDLDGNVGIVALMKARGVGRLLIAANDGRGFLVPVAEVLAETRKGKAVMTPRTGAKLIVVRPVAADADYVAAVGDNRKFLVFPLAELPEMSRGQGVQLQRFREGVLSDATTFVFAEGLSWPMGGDSGRMRERARPVAVARRQGRGGTDATDGFSPRQPVRRLIMAAFIAP